MKSRKPKLGQHFLADHKAAETIVEALGDISGETVIEIGPGRGAITELLLKRAGRLIVIELDHVLAAQMRLKYSRLETLEVVEGDFLRIEIPTLLGHKPGLLTDRTPGSPVKTARVVGNIPYYITSDILLKLFDCHKHFDRFVLMMQKEVADRILAKPGTSDYGLLSATAQLYTHVEKILTLPPGAFNPPPKVHSMVLRFETAPRFEQLGVPEKEFIEFLKHSFGQKRKTLANNLKSHYPDLKAAMKAAGLKEDVRAEAITLEQAAKLFNRLSLVAAAS
ncbi:MAG TPA: 16S rRNA (adenine(1518)-N(6)/adenine(1519)-N(6))-dimethyltransferase RsmA [Terriglobales bacterium]|nr:16S rRNA (adenine(1518)-N(6)/adenine(1519)-N(6))-dimethyltransferase RsmA [Terriglobales bacterium]